MASVYISTADAVVTAINAGVSAGSFIRSFEAARGYDVTADLEDLYGQLRVDVVPAPIPGGINSRGGFVYQPQIDIGIRYKFGQPDENNQGLIQLGEIDAYVELLEQINEHLRSAAYRRLPAYTSACCMKSEIRAPWIQKHLLAWRQYTGLLRLTYFVEKDLS